MILTDTKEKAYIPADISTFNTNEYWMRGFLVVVVGSIFLYFTKKHKIIIQKKSSDQLPRDIITKDSTSETNIFSDKLEHALNPHEMDFLKFIYDHTHSNNSVNIDEINRNLGIQNKSIEIQKKTRRDMINSINEKWCVALNTEQHVIDKNRSAFDKRSYEYFIHADFLAILKKHFS
jgi:hypothetical protein